MATKSYLRLRLDQARHSVEVNGERRDVSELLDNDILVSDVPNMSANGKTSPLFVLFAESSEFFHAFMRMFNALGFFSDSIYDVSVYFIEDEKTAHRYISERLSKDPNMYVAYDQSGMYDDVASYPHNVFETGAERHAGCRFSGDISLVGPDVVKSIADAAIVAARNAYGRDFGFKDDLSRMSTYRNVKSAFDAYGLGYVSFEMSEEEFDAMREQGSGYDTIPERLMCDFGEQAPRYDEWKTWKDRADDTMKVMQVWNHALRISGIPFNVLGYRLNETEVYDRFVDAELTRKIAEMIGVDGMLENIFVHGVPIEDVLA